MADGMPEWLEEVFDHLFPDLKKETKNNNKQRAPETTSIKASYLLTMKMGEGDEVQLGVISDLDIAHIQRVMDKWLPSTGWKALNARWDKALDHITIIVELEAPFTSATFDLRKLESL